MIQQGLMAQASWKTNETVEPVIIFKSFDHRHKLQAASLQGIYKNPALSRERLKTILKGSHGHIGISFDIGKPNKLVFCESFIDLMNYYELHQQSLSDVRLVSMEGLKRSVVAYQTLRLIAEENQKLEFLDTVTPSKLLPLINTIRDTTTYFNNHPDLLTLAVDCDDAGKDFSDKLSQSGLPVLLDLPDNESGKEKVDWNDVLREKKSDLQLMLESAKETLGNQSVRQTSQCLEL